MLATQHKVRIVSAHSLELKGLWDSIRREPFQEGKNGECCLGNTLIEVVLCGVGKRNITSVMGPICQGKEAPSLLINVGFAGALTEGIEPGCWVIGERFVYAQIHGLPVEFSACDPKLIHSARNGLSRSGADFRIGGLVTVDNACSGWNNRHGMFGRTGALAVDMEAYHLALIAHNSGVSFLSLKIISDTVTELPEDAVRSRGAQLSCQIGHVVPDLLVELVSDDENNCDHSEL